MNSKTKSIAISAAVLFALCSLTACSDSQEQITASIQQITTTLDTAPTKQETTETEETSAVLTISDSTDNENTVQQETDVQDQENDIDSETSSEPVVTNNEYAEEITTLMDYGLSGTFSWDETFDGVSEKYNRLLESFIDYPENYELYGGSYYQSGDFYIWITDEERSEVFLDVTGTENVIVKAGDYSYTYLNQIYTLIASLDLENWQDSTRRTGRYIIDESKNRIVVVASSDEIKDSIYAAVENWGFDKNAIEVEIGEFVYANPL